MTDASGMTDPCLLQDHDWPSEIAFLPYVGANYMKGLQGRRVLLLGESQYRREGVSDDPAVTRPYTRETYQDMLTTKSRNGVRLFKRLDQILTHQEDPSAADAAAAWQGVALWNLAQSFTGTQAGDRPSISALRSGSKVLVEHVIPILRPQVILVFGKGTWQGLGCGEIAAEQPVFHVKHVNRNGLHQEERKLWRLDAGTTSAWMSWIYHPSRSPDTWSDQAGVLKHLLDCPLADCKALPTEQA